MRENNKIMYRELYHKAKNKRIADYFHNPLGMVQTHAKYNMSG